MKAVTQEILDFVMAIDFNDLPEAVVHESKRILLDSIGCALVGSSVDKGKISIGLARRLGGPPEASIIGTGDKVSCAGAAFANGELINALEYCALLPPAIHATPCVVSALLALAESMGSSGKDLIVATALAHEVAARLASGMTTSRRFVAEGPEKGRFILPSVTGFGIPIFGGTAGSGKILKLDRNKMAHALGIAGHICAVPTFGRFARISSADMPKYISAGWISEAEVTSALLAEMGYTGDRTVLDGEYGFWRLYGSEEWKPDEVIRKLGEEWRMTSMCYKFYPCGGPLHSALERFSEIIEENNLFPEDIEKVEAWLDPLTDNPRFRNIEVESQMEAQFSVPWVFAVRTHRVPIGADWQDLATIKNPKIREFMAKVSINPHPDFGKVLLEDSSRWIARVEVKAKGKSFVAEGASVKGRPFPEETRATDENLAEKFRHNASKILPWHEIDKAVQAILHLEEMENISELMKLVCSPT